MYANGRVRVNGASVSRRKAMRLLDKLEPWPSETFSKRRKEHEAGTKIVINIKARSVAVSCEVFLRENFWLCSLTHAPFNVWLCNANLNLEANFGTSKKTVSIVMDALLSSLPSSTDASI